MFQGIEHTAISSPDPERLARWYADHLQFRINFVYDGNYFVRAADGTMLEIIPANNRLAAGQTRANNKDAGIRHLAIASDDFDAAYEHLKLKGVVFDGEAFVNQGNRLVFFNDADGNLLHLIQRAKPLPSGLRRTFKAFQYPAFRLMWGGACTSTIGTWMQEIAQNWLVYEKTHSARMLGIDAFLGEIPIFLFSLLGGVVADRMDRRRLLIISQVIQMLSAITLAVLIASKHIQVWEIFVSSFVVGTAQAFGGPAYSALIPSLVDKEDVPNAIALNSIQFNLARVIGPTIGGLAMKFLGVAWCFGVNALSFVAVIWTLLKVNINFKPARTGHSIKESMKQGIHFVHSRASMQMLVLIAFLMTLLGIPVLTFIPVFAKDVFHGDAMMYALFLDCSGLGSIAGALTVAWLGNLKHKGRIALVMLLMMSMGIFGFAHSHSAALSCALLFATSGCLMCAFAMIASLVQMMAPDDMRGRVMSVYNVAFRGGMPLGSMVTGWLVPIFTAPIVLGVNGMILAVVALFFLFVHRKVAELE